MCAHSVGGLSLQGVKLRCYLGLLRDNKSRDGILILSYEWPISCWLQFGFNRPKGSPLTTFCPCTQRMAFKLKGFLSASLIPFFLHRSFLRFSLWTWLAALRFRPFSQIDHLIFCAGQAHNLLR